jgi:acyl dehydratase
MSWYAYCDTCQWASGPYDERDEAEEAAVGHRTSTEHRVGVTQSDNRWYAYCETCSWASGSYASREEAEEAAVGHQTVTWHRVGVQES